MLYSENPIWADVKPIEQDDGPNPLVPIAYRKQYIDAMNYFRAVIRSGEDSERVLALLGDIIDQNPAHYTVWQYRQKVLFNLNSNLEVELEFVNDLIEAQAKNYQVWHHRQVIVENLNKPGNELAFLRKFLDEDSKNYHAWAYRQWVVSYFGLWQDEIPYTTSLLDKDVRNNSAWNHRHFILFSGPSKPSAEQLKTEMEFAQTYIMKAPNNPSGWAYLSGLLAKSDALHGDVASFLQTLKSQPVVSTHVYSLSIELCEKEAQQNKGQISPEALTMCDILAEQDAIRQKYWRYQKTRLNQMGNMQ